MASFEGSLRIPEGSEAPLSVLVDLTEERLRLNSGGVEIANWRLGEVLVNAKSDGFHIHRAGEELVLKVKQDAAFAVMLDLRSVPVELARRMAVYRNSLRQ
ncbi:MAG: hypothetical protein RI637_07865 [Acidimicrobiia bacterium]|nr:hypothetical protein [Acidimicrobiia bacterium]